MTAAPAGTSAPTGKCPARAGDSGPRCALTGKSVSPSAVTAPLAATTMSPTKQLASAQLGARAQPSVPPLRDAAALRAAGARAQIAVSAALPVSKRVFTRCNATTTARATDASSATHPFFTSAAPMAASSATKPKTARLARRAGCPAGRARHAQSGKARDSTPSNPLVRRCVYSMSVAWLGVRGTSSPRQLGQCAPQPAPEPVIRTQAPKTMTNER